MVITYDYATVLIIDIGSTTDIQNDGKKTFFEEARLCASRIIERNIMIQSKNLISIILIGSNKTKNLLAGQCPGAFKYIDMSEELRSPTWQMIKDLPEKSTSRKSDWFEALVVAGHYYDEGVHDVKIQSKKVVLMTNFANPANTGKRFEEVVAGFKESNLELYVIGPNMEENQSKDVEMINYLIQETNGDCATFEEAMSGWLFHKKKAVKLVPQNFDLSIGANIKIPISTYIKVKDEAVVKNWNIAIKNPVTETASTTEGVKKEKTIINTDNQSTLQSEDLIECYCYGQKVIPFSESNKSMLYKSGDRSMTVYGFTNKSSISWQNLQGDCTYYLYGRKNDKNAQYAINCLVQCLKELDLVAIVRKVHQKNSEPKLFVMSPIMDQSGICLSLIGLSYKEEIKNMAFPTTDLKKFAYSDDQVNAFKDLIKTMDLMQAYDDSYGDVEAFPIAETVSPSVQYVLDCIAYRAMNPGKPLPQPRDEIITLFKVPPLLVKKSKVAVDQLIKLFPLNKIEKKKRKQGAHASTNVPHIINDVDMQQQDQLLPKVQLPVLNLTNEVSCIGTVNPVEDYETLKHKGKPLEELASELTEVIQNLVYTNIGGDYSKIEQAMKKFRQDCVENDPTGYNQWLQTFKILLQDRNKNDFLNSLSEKNLNFILKHENELSTLSKDDANDDSQLYNNDTLPDSTEVLINSEIKGFFDDF